MDITNPEVINPKHKKESLKWKIYFSVLIVAAGVGVYLYFWYRSTNEIRERAQKVLMSAELYGVLRDDIKKESDRCKDFIVQKQGDFGGFEYCKKFVEWADGVMPVK